MIYFGPFRWGLEDLKDPNCISAVLNSFLWKCVLICNIIWLKLFNLLANYTIRKPQRRSSRLNQGSCEITEVSDKTLLENTEVSSAPSTLNVQKQHGPTIGKDMVSSYTFCLSIKGSQFEGRQSIYSVTAEPTCRFIDSPIWNFNKLYKAFRQCYSGDTRSMFQCGCSWVSSSLWWGPQCQAEPFGRQSR